MKKASSRRLEREVRRLEREIEDFEQRATLQRTILERQERFSPNEPLYQRLTSIGDDLREHLRRAKDELARRAREKSAPPRWSLPSAVRELVGARG